MLEQDSEKLLQPADEFSLRFLSRYQLESNWWYKSSSYSMHDFDWHRLHDANLELTHELSKKEHPFFTLKILELEVFFSTFVFVLKVLVFVPWKS